MRGCVCGAACQRSSKTSMSCNQRMASPSLHLLYLVHVVLGMRLTAAERPVGATY